jgi:hypothetical protein
MKDQMEIVWKRGEESKSSIHYYMKDQMEIVWKRGEGIRELSGTPKVNSPPEKRAVD